MSRGIAGATTSRGASSLFLALSAAWLFCISSTGCAAVETTLLRGEFDRKEWTVVECQSKERIRVIFPSNVAGRFMQLERELNLTEHEDVLVEFDVAPIASASSGPRTVGVMRIVRVERGTCTTRA
jgi:hypothetical protein